MILIIYNVKGTGLYLRARKNFDPLMQIGIDPLASEACTILVVGGCHITGWGVGPEKSFVSVFSQLLENDGIAHQVHTRPYITLDRPVELAEAIWEVKPNILLMQMGNHEFSPSSPLRKLRHKWGQRFGSKVQENAANRSSRENIPIYQPFHPTFSFRLWQLIKHLGNLFIFYSYYDRDAWTRKVRYIFKTVQRCNIDKVIVLAPFPSANRATNRYRRIGAAILEHQAALHGFQYGGSVNRMITSVDSKSFTVDELHLDARSHRIIGKYIAAVLKKEAKGAEPVIETVKNLSGYIQGGNPAG